jgi:hypothetical protein
MVFVSTLDTREAGLSAPVVRRHMAADGARLAGIVQVRDELPAAPRKLVGKLAAEFAM